MSHFTGIVIGTDIETQLAPYDENVREPEYKTGDVTEKDKTDMLVYYQREKNFTGTFEECWKQYGEDWNGNTWHNDENGVLSDYSTHNKKSKWDWYQLGGRWSGYFKVKDKIGGKLGNPGAFNNIPDDGTADQLLKKHIDFEGMRKDAENKATMMYDLVYPYIKDTPVNEDWKTVTNRITDIDEARTFYHEQERVKAFKTITDKKSDIFGWMPSVEDYNVTREQYIQSARDSEITTYCLIKDGEWHQRGEMGWFGMSSNEMSQEEWNKFVNDTLEALPDDTIISLVDFHI